MQQRNGGRELPERVIFEGIQSQGNTLLGRNHPIVETLTSSVLARALAGDDPQFSRCGAMFTDAVQIRTAVAVLRLRYLLRETTEQFTEEVVMAAFQSAQGGIQWLEPMQQEAIKLMEKAQRGEIKHVAGVNAPYEEPLKPEVLLNTDRQGVDECVAQVVTTLELLGRLKRAETSRYTPQEEKMIRQRLQDLGYL